MTAKRKKLPYEKYVERTFGTEVMRWLNAYLDRKTKSLHLDPDTGSPLWPGQPWDVYSPPDVSNTVSFQEPKPYDLRFFAAKAGGGHLGEFHAVELKLRKSYTNAKGNRTSAYTLPFSELRKSEHLKTQWDNLANVEAQGLNGFGWVLVQFRDFDHGLERSRLIAEQEVYAVRICQLQRLERDGARSITVEQCRDLGIAIQPVKLPQLVRRGGGIKHKPTEVVRYNRNGWDLSPLVNRPIPTANAPQICPNGPENAPFEPKNARFIAHGQHLPASAATWQQGLPTTTNTRPEIYK